jgi:hypothetical protein
MHLKAVLIDPRQQKISSLSIPSPPNKRIFLQAIGRSRAQFVWLSDRTMVAFDGEDGPPGAYFEINASPRLYSKAVVIDREGDVFQDLSLSVAEVASMVQWGRTRRAEGREVEAPAPIAARGRETD